MWDLKGFQIQSETLTFPDGDSFEAIQFWYAEFWHTTFRNAVFAAKFRFAHFYGCTFINCIFSFAGFYGAALEQTHFINCEFVESNNFTNYDLKTVEFKDCYMPNRLFYDCRFDETTIVGDSVARPYRMNPTDDPCPKHELTNIYKGIKEAYVAGDLPHMGRRYFYRQRHAATRHNSQTRGQAIRGHIEELIAGYGVRPLRPLIAMALGLAVSIGVFLTAVPFTDAFLLSAGALFTFGANTEALKALGFGYKAIYVLTAFFGLSFTTLFITLLAHVSFRERL